MTPLSTLHVDTVVNPMWQYSAAGQHGGLPPSTTRTPTSSKPVDDDGVDALLLDLYAARGRLRPSTAETIKQAESNMHVESDNQVVTSTLPQASEASTAASQQSVCNTDMAAPDTVCHAAALIVESGH